MVLKLNGLDQVKRKLDKLSKEASKQAKQALKVQAELPERVAEHLRRWLKGQVNEAALSDIAKDF